MTAVEEDGSWGVLRWRVSRNEDKLEKLGDWQKDVDRDRTVFSEHIGGLRADMKTLKRIGVGIMVSTVCASISFAFTILAAVGKLP